MQKALKIMIFSCFLVGGFFVAKIVRAVYPVARLLRFAKHFGQAGRRKFLLRGFLFSLLIFFGGLVLAAPAYAATEFVSIIDPDSGAGTDYSSLNLWEAAIQANLTATTTKVFSVSSSTGVMADLVSVRGESSNASGTLKHRASSTGQILLVNIVGTFQNGEKVYINGGSTSTNFVILSTAGDSPIAVASCRSSNGTADQTAVTINGWTTASTTYIKIWTDPTTGARHNGKWDTSKYRLEPEATAIDIKENFVRIDGLQILVNVWAYGIAIGYGETGSTAKIEVSNNIVKGFNDNSDYYIGIYLDMAVGATGKVWNNIVFDMGQHSSSEGIDVANANIYLYNNTVHNAYTGIWGGGGAAGVIAKNNIVQNTADGYYGTFDPTYSENNISNIGDAPGTNSKSSTTVAFVDITNKDFHLSPSDTAARNAGTSTILWDANLNFTQDIDGSYRGAAWDIGADEVPTEFVSTICEAGATDCSVTADYHTLSSWENAHRIDISASTTRVFSGYITGTMSKGSYSNMYVGGADTGITVTMQATTTAGQILVDFISGTTTPLTVASGTQFRESGDTAHMWTVIGTLDQLGASPAAVAKIDGTWTNPDTTLVDFYDWTTSKDNYIKIYTTPTARHDGKWNTSRYRLEYSGATYFAVGVQNGDVKIDGLQISINNNTDYHRPLSFEGSGINSMEVSNSIFKASGSVATQAEGFTINGAAGSSVKVWNNIFININGGSGGGGGIYASTLNGKLYAYNNTFHNCSYGINLWSPNTNTIAKNNLFKSCTTAASGYDFAAGTGYNSTDNASMGYTVTGGAVGDRTSQTITFIDETNDNFHLADTDTSAKGAGVNLYSDANINVTNDIDSAARPATSTIGFNWDIGADQTAVKIYRSIAPGATTVLALGGNFDAIIISSSTSLATFNSPLADNIGVGDVIIYNTGGTATATAFIHGRSSSTVYTVKTASGTLPIAYSGTFWSIYRAYTSLANAEAGTENTGIANATIRNFDAWSGGADLVASNTQMNIAAYANGTTADTDGVTIDGWTTGIANYIRIYTPNSTNEVGVSQRHQGKWDESKYRLDGDINNFWILDIREENTRIDGLQIRNSDMNTDSAIILAEIAGVINLELSNSIVRGANNSRSSNGFVNNSGAVNSVIKIWNNIFYEINYGAGDWSGAIMLRKDNNTYLVSNNTIVGGYLAIKKSGATVTVKNNITQNCINTCFATADTGFSASSSNNLSSDGSAVGSNSKINTMVQFVDAANKDFHLAPTDTAALDAGTSTPATDSNLSFTDDIDGQLRRQWDIGADEGSVEYVTSVMESGGNFSTLSAWEAANQVDLATTSTAVFSLSSASGTIPANSSVMGLTSGAVASTTVGSVSTSTQILLYNIASSTFISGERIYIQGGATTSNYAIISNAGNPAIATAKIDGAWANPDTTAVNINGFITGNNNYVRIYSTPVARHNGKWDTSKYRLEFTTTGTYQSALSFNDDHVRIEGLQILQIYSHDNSQFLSVGNLTAGNNQVHITSNIIRGSTAVASVAPQGIRLAYGNAQVKVWNNIIYDIKNSNNTAGTGIVIAGATSTNQIIYNNTVYNTYNAIADAVSNGGIVKNNLVQNSTIGFSGTFSSASDYNLSDIASDAPGTNSKNGVTVEFVDKSNNDFHLSSTDTAARNAGTSTMLWDANLSFTQDIDGSYRGAAWDIGADEVPTEFVSTICENASAGGSCATMDKSTLFAWEADVNSDLTATSTRVFSGSRTGTWADGATLTLYRGATSTGVTGVVVATTSSQILFQSIVGTTTPLNVQNGDTWQLNGSNYWTASGTADQLGASPIAVAKIDGSWAGPETTRINILGWITGYDNYIKIYTTATARHNGKWNDTKYRLQVTDDVGMDISEEYTRIEGLQITTISPTANGRSPLNLSLTTATFGDVWVSNTILKGNNDSAYWQVGLWFSNSTSYITLKFFNNLIYDLNSSLTNNGGFYFNATNSKAFVYNNTVIGSYRGFFKADGNVLLKNNISQSSGIDGFSGSYNTLSDFNISDRAGDAPNATFATTSKAVQFVSTSTGDFHLADTDTAAKGAGVNLYNDANINVTNDIDSAARPGPGMNPGFDIGADQTAVKIYRSIAPGATTALTTGASNALTISSSTSLASFATALADNIGVGDVIIYNTGGTATATAFIHGRSSSTVYTVKTASGTLPTAVSGDTTWSIYRAYTSLYDAERGYENTNILNATIRNFDAWSGGADLVASNTQMNIAAYANGTTADTNAVVIDGWTTGQQNFIKVYTPVSASEVGTSQRHQGKWDDAKYNIRFSADSNNDETLNINDDYVKVDGLQIAIDANGFTFAYAYVVPYAGSAGENTISNSIIRDIDGDADDAITITDTDIVGVYYNNIIYGGFGYGIYASGLTNYIYNNTVIGCDSVGIQSRNTSESARNNMVIDTASGNDWHLVASASSSNNLSDGEAPPGANGKQGEPAFVDKLNKDFHLAPSDTMALDAGTSTITTNVNLSFSDDIDGQLRRQWDIGADEGSVEYVTAVAELGGNFSTLSAWEAANQVDLATNSTAVFSLSSASGTIPANSSVMGLTSGAVASTTVGSVSTSTQILLYNIASSTFISGEIIYIKGGATTSNYAILGNAGNPAIATAKIDGVWTGADTAAVTINGWTTGPNNYVRVYTTPTARHNGKWGSDKYRIESPQGRGAAFNSSIENYIRIDGLQIQQAHGPSGGVGIFIDSGISPYNGDWQISNNLVKAVNNAVDTAIGIRIYGIGSGAKIWNNIVYDFGIGIQDNYSSIAGVFAFNNTVYGNTVGIGSNYANGTVLKNNIAFNNPDNYYGTFHASSTNNLSGSNDAPGSNPVNNVTPLFVDAANKDFHLAPTDTVAKDAGVDLSTDDKIPACAGMTGGGACLGRDIDGQMRGSLATSSAGGLGWDIGADEGATIMYRSVGNTSAALGTGSTVTVASTTVTFAAAQPDNVGVGDVIQYGTPTTLAFITGRSSSTVYSIVNATGTYPVATTSAVANIYRAHTLLNNWQTQTTGTVNQSIDSGLRSQVLVARDLVASNTAMFVAAYASTSPDSYGNSTLVNSWTTGAGNNIKINTPVNSAEVGVSQRHTGKWDDTKYRIVLAKSDSDGYYVIRISNSNIQVEGLQVYGETSGSAWFVNGITVESSLSNVKINSNIVKGNVLSGASAGIAANAGSHYIWNNIVYGFKRSDNSYGIGASGGAYVYSNTVYGNTWGIWAMSGSSGNVLINNIAQNNTIDIYADGGTWGTSTDYNIATDTTAPGVHSKNSTIVNFINTAASSTYDFHLAPTDRAARDAGVSLAADPYLPFATDIDGNARPYAGIWDIGADEDAASNPDYRFNGWFKLKGFYKFK